VRARRDCRLAVPLGIPHHVRSGCRERPGGVGRRERVISFLYSCMTTHAFAAAAERVRVCIFCLCSLYFRLFLFALYSTSTYVICNSSHEAGHLFVLRRVVVDADMSLIFFIIVSSRVVVLVLTLPVSFPLLFPPSLFGVLSILLLIISIPFRLSCRC
jgi:predicted permease